MVEAERAENSWIASETSPSSSPVVIESSDFSITDGMRDVSGFGIASRPQLDKGLSENNIGFTERVFSAAGAAVLSAVTLNPLDVVKVGAFYCCLDSSGKLYLLTGEDLMFLLWFCLSDSIASSSRRNVVLSPTQ